VTGSSYVGALVGFKNSGILPPGATPASLEKSFYLTKPNLEAVNNATDGGATKITAGNKTFTGFDVNAWTLDDKGLSADGKNWPIFKGWNTLFLGTTTDPQGKNPLP